MPELPEVETIRRGLDKELTGLVVGGLWWDEVKMLQPDPEAVRAAVVGARFTRVSRRAKLLIFELSTLCHPERAQATEESLIGLSGQGILPPRPRGQDDEGSIRDDSEILSPRRTSGLQNDPLKTTHIGGQALNGFVYFLIHLRLSGRLLFRNQSDPADDYVHVKFVLSEGKELRFANARKFGYVKLATAEEVEGILASYGPEPLDDLTLGDFKKILSRRKIAIKKLLLDQKAISGVGNIYANDALWVAGVSPQQSADSLSARQLDGLFKAIEEVLREGLETGGASDQWYRNAYGEKGSYQEHFKVYGKTGQPCSRCGTAIERIEVGGRGTFYCPVCQRVE